MWDTRSVTAISKILCPVDLSDASRRAFEQAAHLAQKCDAELIVLHVMEEAPLFTTYGGVPDVGMQGETERMARTDLESLAATAPSGTKVRTDSFHGQSSKAILQYAEENNVDLIVMGTHGRSGLERVVFGSVTERVLRRSHCPVMVVPVAGAARAADAGHDA